MAAHTHSTEDSRRAFVLRNYESLRNRIESLPDPTSSDFPPYRPYELPTMAAPGRWTQRWEYLEDCDRELRELGERAMATPGGGGNVEVPSWVAGGAGLIAGVLKAEEQLSDTCVRFIHAPAEIADKVESKRYLFRVFKACEEAWRRAARGKDPAHAGAPQAVPGAPGDGVGGENAA